MKTPKPAQTDRETTDPSTPRAVPEKKPSRLGRYEGLTKSGQCRLATEDYKTFLDNVKEGSVDLVLTDPPYAISRETGFANGKPKVKRFAVSMDFGPWDHQEIDLEALATGAYRVLREGGTVIIWYDLWKITPLRDALDKAGFRMLRTIVWQKTNPVPLNSQRIYLSNSREIAVVGVKGSNPTFNSKYDDGVYAMPIPRHKGRRIHPTQKSLDIFLNIVEKHSLEGNLICDPFAGSGTTAIASLQLKRKFCGCDIDSKYVNLIKERIDRVEDDPVKLSKAEIFKQLAQPDESGWSREVPLKELESNGLWLGKWRELVQKRKSIMA